ncbi:MAG: cysteine desulfurase [Clostridiales bacterium]|nr:cysteine desulfurase [Clostridiales bacterium]
MFNLENIRKDFPILSVEVNKKRLAYLDNGATSQKPLYVIDAMSNYNKRFHGNPHRGSHYLSVAATEKYDEAKKAVTRFINAGSSEEIIFTKNATEALNLVAHSYGNDNIGNGDEIVIAISEHHSNILPWQRLAKEKGAVLKYLYLNEDGRITSKEIKAKITNKTKIVSVAHISNVLGTIHPVKEIIDYAHKMGSVVIIDGAQGVSHINVDVQDLDADFYIFSGHKMLGPMGIGVLYGKKDLLDNMSPFLLGGDMIEYVYEQEATFAPIPFKFEAGTQNVEGAVGLRAAIEYIENIGMEAIIDHERDLTAYALEKLLSIPYIQIQGPKDTSLRGGILSFTIDDVHPHDVASILDSYGVAIRAGHHCAQPLMRYMNVSATSRASFHLYNNEEDVDQLIEGLKNVRKWLGYGS